MLKVYGYDKCGTCRNAAKWLKSHDQVIESIPLFEQPPTVAELKKLVADSGLALKKFFNTSGEVYKEMGLKDKLASMSEAEQLELLASNGRLIKRPIVTNGKQVTIGFKEPEYEQTWSR
ncbi:Regulatory protein MgsR [compost metagenome]